MEKSKTDVDIDIIVDESLDSNTYIDTSKRKFGIRDIIGYGAGDFGCNMSFSLISNYMMIYYTQWIGIKPTHYAWLILVAKIIDAINDPIIGSFIDSRDPRGKKREKFKPWILYGMPFLAIAACIMFFDSSAYSYNIRLAVASIGYIAWDFMYTVVNVPYGSLSSVITNVPTERASLSTARSFGSYSAQIPLQMILPIALYVGQDFLGNRMLGASIVLGIVSIISFSILLLNTEERIIHKPKLEKEKINGKKEKYNFFKVIKGFISNRAIVGISLASIGQIVFIASATTLNTMTFQVYFKNGKLASLIVLTTFIPVIISALFGGKLIAKYGKKEIATLPTLISFFIFAAMAIVPISNPYIWLLLMLLANITGLGFNIYVWAMVSDSIDYQQYITGDRNEGTIYSLYSMVRKFAQALGQFLIPFLIGTLIPGLLLDDKSTWTAEYAGQIKLMSAIFQAAGWLLIFISMKFVYNLTKDKLKEVEKEIN